MLRRRTSPSFVYSVLKRDGYNYATLANGVVTGTSMSGAAAMNFMRLTARESGRSIDENQIFYAMVDGYLGALSRQLVSQGVINRDINHQEAWELHNKVFSKFGISPDAWTLNSVFKIMPSDSVREAYWQETLASAGNPGAELLMAFRTQTFMATASVIGTPEAKLIANKWLSRVDTLSTYRAAGAGFGGALQQRIDALFDSISQSVFGTPMSQLPPVDFASLPALAPTPSPAVTITPMQPAAPIPAPPVPKPPVRPKRPPRGRPRPGPTTGSGHPDSGHHGGRSGAGGGGPVVIIGNRFSRTVKP
jgi:hypothetical protein